MQFEIPSKNETEIRYISLVTVKLSILVEFENNMNHSRLCWLSKKARDHCHLTQDSSWGINSGYRWYTLGSNLQMVLQLYPL